MTKQCYKCKRWLELDAFAKNSGKKDGRSGGCKECHNTYNKEYYKENHDYYKNRAKQDKKKLVEWYFKQKTKHKCQKCGESHPACIDFHHKDKKNKLMSLARMPRHGFSKEKILEEIDKCIPLCANCHRKEHFYVDYKLP